MKMPSGTWMWMCIFQLIHSINVKLFKKILYIKSQNFQLQSAQSRFEYFAQNLLRQSNQIIRNSWHTDVSILQSGLAPELYWLKVRKLKCCKLLSQRYFKNNERVQLEKNCRGHTEWYKVHGWTKINVTALSAQDTKAHIWTFTRQIAQHQDAPGTILISCDRTLWSMLCYSVRCKVFQVIQALPFVFLFIYLTILLWIQQGRNVTTPQK